MNDSQILVEKIRKAVQEGGSAAEIYKSIIPEFGKDPQRDESVAHLLGDIPHGEIGALLGILLEASHEKRVRKALKRSIYRLRSRGVPIQEGPPEPGRSVLRRVEASPGSGLASAIDYLGNRLLFLGLAHPGHGWMVMQGVVSDMEGFIEFSAREMSRKAFRSALKEVRETTSLPVVEMEADYVAFLFAKAHRLTVEKKRTPPADYLRVRNEVERGKKAYDRALIYEEIPKEQIAGDEWLLERSGDLPKSDLFLSWRIEEDRIEPYADLVRDTRESKIVLHQSQKEFRVQDIYVNALSDLFPEERRLVLKERLEEMAYVLLRLARQDEARAAVAAAVDLEKPLNPIRPNPFLFQWVIKSIYTRLAEVKEKGEKEPSFIVKP
jgi:hypothetical protein